METNESVIEQIGSKMEMLTAPRAGDQMAPPPPLRPRQLFSVIEDNVGGSKRPTESKHLDAR